MKRLWLIGRKPGVVVRHPRARLRLDGTVTGAGTLQFGVQWPGRFHRESHLVLRRGGALSVTGDFSIYSGATVTVGEGASLSLGDGYINGDASISCFVDVRIGRGVAIGPELMLIDDDRHQLTGTRRTSGPIVIGDHVWLGARVTVLKGVTIGDDAIVAAGAVVTKDIPPAELWGGVPANAIRTAHWS